MSRPSIPGFMEEHLDTPIKDVLQTIQNGILNETSFCGVRTYKSPMDAWVYQELIWDLHPEIIIEIGTKFGGSALYLASILDAAERVKGTGRLGSSIVITVDIDHSRVDPLVYNHWRIKPIEGDACGVIDKVREWFPATYQPSTLIIEDSAHTYENTLNVLRTYSPLQSFGDYFVVEDTIANHGLDRSKKWPRGPYEAVTTFLEESDLYQPDRTREKFFVTWNPRGYLRRMK